MNPFVKIGCYTHVRAVDFQCLRYLDGQLAIGSQEVKYIVKKRERCEERVQSDFISRVSEQDTDVRSAERAMLMCIIHYMNRRMP